ncbi:hypothetical protein [Thermanaerosceptrum fracticalcis]|uniref:hypothetical protein n=1 Tax=Thermanaerosceptrum fracticalcis TaxID=1712410 RepID=UPI003084010E
MEQTITAKIQIHPTAEQIIQLQETLRKVRDGLNFVSKYIYSTKCLSQRTIHDNTYYDLRANFGLRSQMAQSVIKTAIAKYKSASSNGHEITHYLKMVCYRLTL